MYRLFLKIEAGSVDSFTQQYFCLYFDRTRLMCTSLVFFPQEQKIPFPTLFGIRMGWAKQCEQKRYTIPLLPTLKIILYTLCLPKCWKQRSKSRVKKVPNEGSLDVWVTPWRRAVEKAGLCTSPSETSKEYI